MTFGIREQSDVKGSPYTWRRKLRDQIRIIPANILNLRGAPGRVKDLDFPDPLTGDRLQIRTRSRYTIIAVNNRELVRPRLRSL